MIIGRLLRNIKYRHQRAKGILPDCDWWEYKYTLVDNIKQGVEGLLYKGCRDWDSSYHKKEKEELEFVLKWAEDFPKWDSSVWARDEEEKKSLEERFGNDFLVVTSEEIKEWQKRSKKAFEYLGKNIHGLWD